MAGNVLKKSRYKRTLEACYFPFIDICWFPGYIHFVRINLDVCFQKNVNYTIPQ